MCSCLEKICRGKPVSSGQKIMIHNIYAKFREQNEALSKTEMQTINEMEETHAVKSPPRKRNRKILFDEGLAEVGEMEWNSPSTQARVTNQMILSGELETGDVSTENDVLTDYVGDSDRVNLQGRRDDVVEFTRAVGDDSSKYHHPNRQADHGLYYGRFQTEHFCGSESRRVLSVQVVPGLTGRSRIYPPASPEQCNDIKHQPLPHETEAGAAFGPRGNLRAQPTPSYQPKIIGGFCDLRIRAYVRCDTGGSAQVLVDDCIHVVVMDDEEFYVLDDVLEEASAAKYQMVPTKSKLRYQKELEIFTQWQTEKRIKGKDESSISAVVLFNVEEYTVYGIYCSIVVYEEASSHNSCSDNHPWFMYAAGPEDQPASRAGNVQLLSNGQINCVMWSGSAYNGAAAWICMDGGSEQCDKLLHSAVFGTSGNVKNGEQFGVHSPPAVSTEEDRHGQSMSLQPTSIRYYAPSVPGDRDDLITF
ncbi:hypothetical protein GEV33_012759 [Tenebrio molitor]|uniref:Uncharacterized protein n=1 Tax=Tenebrio molitor TaxID=7067 RepID=A0A8J6H9R8_TENMO|nr:hypothetical protein GEV33_012759 [Tenebrio molitor]